MLRQEEFLLYLRSRGYKEGTLKYKEIYLYQFNLWLSGQRQQDIKQVTGKTIRTYQHYLVNEYRKKDQRRLSPLTILSKLSVLRKYFRYLVKTREIFLDPTIDIKLPKSRDYLPKNILTKQEAKHLLTLPGKNTVVGIRDQAILELLYTSGIRRQELCKLCLYDIDLKDKSIHIRTPKNRKDRIVPIGSKAKEAIEKYLLISRPRLGKDIKERAVFLSRSGRRISKETLNYIVKSYSRKMRIEKKVTPHCLRHSCATHLLQNGSSLRIIQRILGHSRISSTEIYTRVVPEDLKKMILKHHPRGRADKVAFLRKKGI